MKKIKVVIKKGLVAAEVAEIEPKLEEFQRIVGGNIEGVCPDEFMAEHNIVIYCDDEGKLKPFIPNIWICHRQDIIAGTCVFVKADDEGCDVSLSDEEIEYVKAYCRRNEVTDGDIIRILAGA